jgi:Family of unknown function (DUF5681)
MNTTDDEQTKGSESDTSVGYGKPPEDTRFKKGVSGNPKGRPKGSRNVGAVLAKTLREKVVINEHGQRKTISKLEAAIKQFVNKAASGDLRALHMLVGLAREAEAQEAMASGGSSPIGEIDQRVTDGIFKRFQPVAPVEGDEADEKPSAE